MRISLRAALLFEVMRIYALPDAIELFDLINDQTTQIGYQELSQRFKMPISYTDLQDLLIGEMHIHAPHKLANPSSLGSIDYSPGVAAIQTIDLIKEYDTNTYALLSLEATQTKVKAIHFHSSLYQDKVFITYEYPQNEQLPSSIHFSLSLSDKSILLDIKGGTSDISEAAIRTSLTKRPRGNFQRVELSDLLKQLSN